MKCYSPGYRIEGDNNPHPTKAYTFESKEECISKYEEFVSDCINHDYGTPAPLWVYEGAPDGDEEMYGYPDFPDYIVRLHTTRHKVIWETA